MRRAVKPAACSTGSKAERWAEGDSQVITGTVIEVNLVSDFEP
jgi:hypothetical protein